jgi:rhodanese-related sulfurtransferase
VAVREVTVDDLAAVIAAGRAPVVDVREAAEYATGHVPGARHVPLAELPGALDALRTADAIYVICAVGGRSMYACEWLHDQGVTQAINVAGGTKMWAMLGHPLETGGAGA